VRNSRDLADSQRSQILEPLDVAVAAPQAHPLASDLCPADPLDRLLAIGRSAHPVAGTATHHPHSFPPGDGEAQVAVNGPRDAAIDQFAWPRL
jgi:hypothetical protein